ncbi:holo-(acyl-carrier-protein) synthase [Ligilactobacillus acidipiscis DSM 15836]|uniref:Holo-[acyl-carrier-protein] synthase n=1 Tax=Ligilactobacillus acidipiscis DSM 15836 TaxID=1423716 RepID=A0ABR5PIM2_9LACO|nr:holo-(acyl-carrier-protein) synthase [Ligilactobacillus acidipiscis DSM 15836]
MVIVGLGVDITDLSRIKRAQERGSHFARRVLTPNELQFYGTLSQRRQLEFLGGRYSAKEAYSKAYGTGIGSHLSFQDIEILNEDSGQPQIVIQPLGEDVNCLVSISHTAKLVLTEVVLER